MCTVEQSLRIVVEEGGAYNMVDTDGVFEWLTGFLSG
jgi:hypothetical protein